MNIRGQMRRAEKRRWVTIVMFPVTLRVVNKSLCSSVSRLSVYGQIHP